MSDAVTPSANLKNRTVEIRILSPITTVDFRHPDQLTALCSPGVTVTKSAISRGPGSIESEYELAMATPELIVEAVRAEREGAHALIIDCMGDPGLSAVREAVTIPVLGPGETAMHIASMLSHRFTVLTVLRRIVSTVENAAAKYGVLGKMASVRPVNIPVLELEHDIDATRKALIDLAERAVEQDGAEAVIFGCTGLLGSAAAVRAGLLARGIDIPVIDPIPTAVNIAAALVRSNLSHSALTYPFPPEKSMKGYDMPAFGPLAVAAE